MKLIPTFCDGNFHGYETMKEIIRLRNEAHDLALSKQEDENALHMVYGYFDYDNDGNIVTARLYSGIACDEKKFDAIASLRHAHIYAIHKKN